MLSARRLVLPIVTTVALLASGSAAAAQPGAPGGGWSPLGGELLPTAGNDVTEISLALGPDAAPLLGLSTIGPEGYPAATTVSRWADDTWAPFGEPIPADRGSVAVDRHGQPWLCTTAVGGGARNGPAVFRWTADGWSQVGGEIAAEAGYAESPRRYLVGNCSSPVFDASGAPVVAWTANVGSKANYHYVARWDAEAGRWTGLDYPERDATLRSTGVHLAADRDGAIYAASFRPGGGYSSSYVTRVDSWDGTAWTPIGEWEGTDGAMVVAGRHGVYTAHRVRATGQVELLRWRAGAWTALPSPGAGAQFTVEASRSGRLWVAIAANAGEPDGLRVLTLRGGTWRQVGDSVGGGPLAGTPYGMALAVDRAGRPTLAWVRYIDEVGYSVHAARYQRAATAD